MKSPHAFSSARRVPFAELVQPTLFVGDGIFSALRAFVGPLVTVTANARRAWAVRRTVAELSALDDRLLADIGISRGQILAIAEAAIDHPGRDPRRGV